jgi:hypothetical protein
MRRAAQEPGRAVIRQDHAVSLQGAQVSNCKGTIQIAKLHNTTF